MSFGECLLTRRMLRKQTAIDIIYLGSMTNGVADRIREGDHSNRTDQDTSRPGGKEHIGI